MSSQNDNKLNTSLATISDIDPNYYQFNMQEFFQNN